MHPYYVTGETSLTLNMLSLLHRKKKEHSDFAKNQELAALNDPKTAAGFFHQSGISKGKLKFNNSSGLNKQSYDSRNFSLAEASNPHSPVARSLAVTKAIGNSKLDPSSA